MIGIILAAALAFQTTATSGASLQWDMDDAELAVGPIAVFLVCLDGQATAECARVDVASGVVSGTGQRTWTWKLPPLLAGTHTVTAQACTANAAACSSGATLKFAFAAIANPKNLRLGGAK